MREGDGHACQAAKAALTPSNAETCQAHIALDEARRVAEAVAARPTQQITLLVAANHELLAANEDQTRTHSDLRERGDDFLLPTEEGQRAVEIGRTRAASPPMS